MEGSVYGQTFKSDTSNYGIDLGNQVDFSIGNGTTDSPFSIFTSTTINSYSGFAVLMSKDGANREWTIFVTTDGTIRFFIFTGSSNSIRLGRSTGAGAIVLGAVNNVACTYDGSGNNSGVKITVDGVRVDVSSNENPPYVASNNKSVIAEIGTTNTFGPIDGEIHNAVVWKGKELDIHDAQQLHKDPFLMYRPSVSLPFLGAGGAPSTTITPYYYQLMG
jgi:hypothetical protein